MSGLLLYLSLSILWGVFAVKLKETIYPDPSLSQEAQTLVINTVGAPIAILVAISKFDKTIKTIRD